MKISRTLYLFCAIYLMTFTVHAAMQGNWLVGVSGDYATRKGNVDIAMAYTAIPAFPLTEIIVEHTDKGIYWGVLVGYQLKCNGWTWGAEVNLDWPDIGDTFQVAFSDVGANIGWNSEVSYEAKPLIGLSGRIAYEMAPYFIPFMRLGIATTKDKFTASFSSTSPLFPMNIAIEESSWHAQYIAGFGVDVPLMVLSKLFLRLEYDYYSFFSHKDTQASGTITTGVIRPSFTAHMHPRTQSGKIALIWNF